MNRQLFIARWLRSHTSLCREGLYYLMIMVLVFAGAMIKEVNLLLLLGGIILELFLGGLPAFKAFGLPFIWSDEWDPVQEVFGAGVSIYGTLVTAALAMLLAVPLAFGVAVYLHDAF